MEKKQAKEASRKQRSDQITPPCTLILLKAVCVVGPMSKQSCARTARMHQCLPWVLENELLRLAKPWQCKQRIAKTLGRSQMIRRDIRDIGTSSMHATRMQSAKISSPFSRTKKDCSALQIWVKQWVKHWSPQKHHHGRDLHSRNVECQTSSAQQGCLVVSRLRRSCFPTSIPAKEF